MLNDKKDTIIYNVMANIAVKDLIPKGSVTVSCSRIDGEGKLHTKKSNNVLYFPYSPVNIINATTLAESMKDN